MRQFLKNFALVAVGLIAGIAATIQLSATAQQAAQLPLDELRTLSNVFAQIKREYVEPIEDKQLLTDAVKGMVSSLDPHSTFLDKKDFDITEKIIEVTHHDVDEQQKENFKKMLQVFADEVVLLYMLPYLQYC